MESKRKDLNISQKKNDLNNVRFENFVSRDDYSDLLKICSLGMVCLSPKNKTPVIPGKILGYMASGLPVAAFLHKSSDGHKVIKNSGCGLGFLSLPSIVFWYSKKPNRSFIGILSATKYPSSNQNT